VKQKTKAVLVQVKEHSENLRRQLKALGNTVSRSAEAREYVREAERELAGMLNNIEAVERVLGG
jgi:hypothetical protein